MHIKSYLPPPEEILTISRRDETTKRMIRLEYKITGYELEPGMRSVPATAELLDNQQTKVVVKFPNLDENRSPQSIKERIDQFSGDVQREVDAWGRLRLSKANNHIATVYGTGAYECEINDMRYSIPYFVQEFVEGLSLKKWCRTHFGDPFNGIKDVAAWFKLGRKLVEVLGWIHQERVIHADIWEPNILIRAENGEPVFIDFGQAWRLDQQLFAQSTDSTPYAYYAPERLKSAEGPWYQPADIYSICGILYYLATGDHPPLTIQRHQDRDGMEIDEPIHKADTKKQIVRSIQEKNQALYEANLGIPDIILYGLRPIAHERATYAEEVLEVMDCYYNAFQQSVYKPLPRLATDLDGEESLKQQVNQLSLLIDKLQQQNNQIHYRLLKRDLSYLSTQVNSLIAEDFRDPKVRQRSQLYSLRGGDRDDLVKYMLAAFSGLRSGDHVLAQTTPIFWRKENFGANGRLLTMIKMAATHGINIRWVLLIEELTEWQERYKSGLNGILEAHQDAVNEARGIAGMEVMSKSIETAGFYLGYRLIPEEQRKSVIRMAKTFIVLNERDDEGNDNFTAILPNYTERDGSIASVRLWRRPWRWQEQWQSSLVENLSLSMNVLEYVPSVDVKEQT